MGDRALQKPTQEGERCVCVHACVCVRACVCVCMHTHMCECMSVHVKRERVQLTFKNHFTWP